MNTIIKKYYSLLIAILLGSAIALPSHAASYDKYLRDMTIDESSRTIVLVMDEDIARKGLNEKKIRKIYKSTKKDLGKALPKSYRTYNVVIMVGGRPIESYLQKQAPEPKESKESKPKVSKGWWGNIAYTGNPWVSNISQPHTISRGLQGRHLSVWASHGRFYDHKKHAWRWQRPNMFCTTEDLFTQTIVVPYLIPMLERAGANVFTPRERDWQTAEVVVDNDSPTSGYSETTTSGQWRDADTAGFAQTDGVIYDGYNPFEYGTTRMTSATKRDDTSEATYKPHLPKAGRYAVYVSYTTKENSVSDALYSVYHRGQRTDFHVNQRMGGGTWVYLGTFDFGVGTSEENKVVVSAMSDERGVVTTDAVRFGGGMGNIARGGATSGLPRALEGARYYAQWAGAPRAVYSTYNGEDDYKDDINVRSLMTNWLAGGSPYVPNKSGKGVPIDLSLAVHSDAGYNDDMTSIYGSLAICTTDAHDGLLDAGLSRNYSMTFCEQLLRQIKKDVQSKYGDWAWRDLYDRNYSETRLPAMPSAIIETLSHQSFPDMRLGHDPDFKFTLARSIYKTILRFEGNAHGTPVVVSPLKPTNIAAVVDSEGNVHLSWEAQKDGSETTAQPDSYNIYTATGDRGYDNGINVTHNNISISLQPNLLYRFKVTAVNAGGESFPSEEMSVIWQGPYARNILIVNGFTRLSGPAQVNGTHDKGFDIITDPGVSEGLTAAWAGAQQVFSTATAGKEGPGTFAYCGNEMAGKFVAGNDFNYTTEHAMAIRNAGQYNVSCVSRNAVEWGIVNLRQYDLVDIILGNERYDANALRKYKTFTPQLQKKLADYCDNTYGALLISGSYVGSDMQSDNDRTFLSRYLHITPSGTVRGDNAYATGLQQTMAINNQLNADHYATTQSDILSPTGNAFTAMLYNNRQSAAVAYTGKVNTFTMGFPFECIKSTSQREKIMRGIVYFLMNNR